MTQADEPGTGETPPTPTGPLEGVDLDALVGVLETQLLGESAHYTRADLVERSGLPRETAEALWKALGFAHVEDDEVAFGEADLVALQQTAGLIESGVLDEGSSSALVRTWGRSFARLAEWQSGLLADVAERSEDPWARLQQLSAETIPTVESLQGYVWRRHLLNASTRLLNQPASEDAELGAVGFVDIVGYTARSKDLDGDELLGLVEHFESVASSEITDQGGRLIKTIGDEVLFVCDDTVAAARVARALVERHTDDPDFPEVRAGVAHGPVFSRLGDVFGSTVNLASRLTSLARPGSVLIDRGAREALEVHDPDGEEFWLRRLPRTSLKGFHHVEVWRIRRSRSSTDD